MHANCRARIISDPPLERELMKKMVARYEEKNQTNWKYDLPDDFHNKLLKSIVWVKLTVENFEAKFKLSQNREKEDYLSVVDHLSKRGTDNDKEILHYMELTNPFFSK